MQPNLLQVSQRIVYRITMPTASMFTFATRFFSQCHADISSKGRVRRLSATNSEAWQAGARFGKLQTWLCRDGKEGNPSRSIHVDSFYIQPGAAGFVQRENCFLFANECSGSTLNEKRHDNRENTIMPPLLSSMISW